MSRKLVRTDIFIVDAASHFAWYATEAETSTAERFLTALESTIDRLDESPELGRVCGFTHPALRDLRSIRVDGSFASILIFYRLTTTELILWRLLHGARDLPRHLAP